MPSLRERCKTEDEMAVTTVNDIDNPSEGGGMEHSMTASSMVGCAHRIGKSECGILHPLG